MSSQRKFYSNLFALRFDLLCSTVRVTPQHLCNILWISNVNCVFFLFCTCVVVMKQLKLAWLDEKPFVIGWWGKKLDFVHFLPKLWVLHATFHLLDKTDEHHKVRVDSIHNLKEINHIKFTIPSISNRFQRTATNVSRLSGANPPTVISIKFWLLWSISAKHASSGRCSRYQWAL